MTELKAYKVLPRWSAQTLPPGFRKKHNTKEGTWGRLTVFAGAFRFDELDESGEVIRTRVLDANAGPQLVAPESWHKVAPESDDLECQLEFLCTPERYFEKKYQLTAPHSEVVALMPHLEDAGGNSVLDLGSGRGRNSFYLASRGFRVTAVDQSESAIETLREIQTEEKLDVTSHIYDINRAKLADVMDGDEVDHLVSTVVFQFLNPDHVSTIIEDAKAATRRGGIHLIVAPVTSAEVPCTLAFPFLFQRGELREAYGDWDVVRYEEALGEFHRTDESGRRHQAEFATLVARKPVAR